MRRFSPWPEVPLAAVVGDSKYGLVDGPFGSAVKKEDYSSTGVPVLRGVNLGLGDCRLKLDDLVYIPERLAQKHGRALAKPGDVVFTKKGTLGSVGFIPAQPFDTYFISSNQMKATVDQSRAEPLFVYYVFAAASTRERLIREASITGVPKINLQYLRRFPVPLPPLPEQKRIADILGALDDKIELNRKMNETLEEMAQAIFKSWFIDFDGHTEFEDSELGRIPLGWTATTLGKMCETHGVELRTGPFGTALKRDEYVPQGVPVVAVRDIRHGYVELDEKTPRVPADVAERLGVYRLQEGDILFGRKGAVERSAVVPRQQVGWVMGTDCIRLRLPAWMEPSVWGCGFRTPAHTAWMAQHATGSTMASLNQRILAAMPIVLPAREELTKGASAIEPLLARAVANRAEDETLAELRDTLLPKLISGELRVPEAEKAVEAVA